MDLNCQTLRLHTKRRTLNAALLGGVNFMLHACGWLEGGLVSSFEKFVLDADQLGILHHLAKGVSITENDQALDAIHEVGPGDTISVARIPKRILKKHSGVLKSSIINLMKLGKRKVQKIA